MANNNTINVGLNVTSNLEDLNKKIKESQRELNILKKMAKEMASTTVGAAGNIGKQESQEYAVARSTVGTGAAGRDFAKQAQGLGGVVHLYATFAANLFAVEAAFRGLSNAFATERLTSAAATMSASIGINMKGLAEDLQKATGYAISFQDALKFSNTGIAAGLTSKQIQNLTIIAKGAANALGRDMNDAIDRIIRGTAKMEQEILDELGIFVRANTAYKEYAKQLNITNIDQLTAAQRVQAYAQAVEKAGEKWKDFAAVDDPFSKFLASLQEVGVKLLNILNTVIAPVLGYLSQSQSTIAGIITLITAKLFTAALPKFGEAIKSMFSVDTESIKKKADEAYNIYVDKQQKTIDKLKAQKQAASDAINLKANLQEFAVPQNPKLASAVSSQIQLRKVSVSDIEDLSNVQQRHKFEELINSSLNTRVAQINRIKDPQTRSAELTKLQSLDFVKQDELANKLVVDMERVRAVHQAILGVLDGETIALADQQALVASIAAETKVLEEVKKRGQAGSRSERAVKNADALNTGVEEVSGALLNKGLNPIQKFTEAWKAAGSAISETSGLASKAWAGLRLAGVALASGLEALMGPLGIIMGIMAAWDIVIKPLLEHFGVFTDAQAKVAETSQRFAEGVKVASDAIRKNSEELAFNGVSLEALTSKYVTAKRILDELTSKRDDAIKEYNASSDKFSWLEKQLGQNTKAAQGLVNSLYESAKAQQDLANKTGDMASVRALEEITNKLGMLRGASKEYIDKNLPAMLQELQTVTSAESKVTDSSKAAVDNLNGIVNQGSGAITKFQQDVIEKSDKFAKGIKNDNVRTFYFSIAQLSEKVAEGNQAAIGSLITLIDNLPKELQDKMPQMVALIKELKDKTSLNGIPGMKALVGLDKGSPLAQDLSSRAGKAGKEAATSIDTTIGNPKTQKIDQTFAIEKQFLDIQNKKITRDQDLINTQKQLYEKRHGYVSDDLLDQEASILQQKNYLEYANNILQIEEKRAQYKKDVKDGRISGNDLKKYLQALQQEQDFAEKVFSEGRSTIIDKTAAQKTFESERNLKQLNTHQLATYQLKTKQLDIDKELGLISETQYSYQKEQADILALTIQYKNDSVGKSEEEKSRLLEILKLNISNTQKESEKNRVLLARQQLLEKLTTSTSLGTKYLDAQLNLDTSLNGLGLNQLDISKSVLGTLKSRIEALGKIEDKELYSLKIKELEVQAVEELNALYEKQLELKLKEIDMGKRDVDMQTIYDVAEKKAVEFGRSLKSSIEGSFDAVYAGMDAAIDDLTTKWMKSEKFSFKELVTTFRNTAAEEFRKLAADKMKLFFRESVASIFKSFGVVSKEDREAAIREKVNNSIIEQLNVQQDQLTVQQDTSENIAKLLEYTSKDSIQAKRSQIEDRKQTGILDESKKADKGSFDIFKKIFSFGGSKSAPIDNTDGSSSQADIDAITKANQEYYGVLSDASMQAKEDTNSILEQTNASSSWWDKISTGATNVFGADGIVMGLFKNMGTNIGGIFNTIFGALGIGGGSSSGGFDLGGLFGGGGGIGDLLGGMGGDIGSFLGDTFGMTGPMGFLSGMFFKDGGIMTPYGPLKLNKYANGGVASSPQLALYGEGKNPEAYVPLPDGRSIPVTMNQEGNSGGAVSVNINITDNSTTTDVSQQSGTKDHKQMAQLIAARVQEEIIRQKRPGGLLY